MTVSRWVGGTAVAAFIAVSTVMAFRFGWTLGSTAYDQWLYATVGASADAVKAFLPLLITAAWSASQYLRCLAATALFTVVTAFSLTSSFGLAALQRADKLSVHAAMATTYHDRRAELDRLIAERAKINARPVAENAETLAQEAISQADASARSECAKRGPECRKLEGISRQKRDELASIVTAKAALTAAADLDHRIEAARASLSMVDEHEAHREADPQAAALARLTGQSEDGMRTALHLLIALLIELGSGMGTYIVFGRRTEDDVVTVSDPPVTPQVPVPDRPTSPLEAIDPPAPTKSAKGSANGGADDVVPPDVIERFVAEQVRSVEGGRIAGADLFSAYTEWCQRQGLDPVTSTAFGRQVPWNKARIGGRVYYMGAALAVTL
jgi:hypothetical protein